MVGDFHTSARALFFISLTIACAACSNAPAHSGSGDDASVDAPIADAGGPDVTEGSVGGKTLSVVESFSYDESAIFSQCNLWLVERSIKLVSYAGACAIEEQRMAHKAGSTHLKFLIGVPSGGPVVPAEYQIAASTAALCDVFSTTKSAVVLFRSFDAACTKTETTATGGSVTVTDVDGGISGTYALEFPNGDKLSGTFVAPDCPAPTGVDAGACVQ